MKDNIFKAKKMVKEYYDFLMEDIMKGIFIIIYFMDMVNLINLINCMKAIEFLINWRGYSFFLEFTI